MSLTLLGVGAGPQWPKGADGALSINGTTVNLAAGSLKDYSSISIINNGILEVVNDPAFENNDGSLPTIIGCSGNCTINTGGLIRLRQNAGVRYSSTSATVSTTPPAGASVTPVSYSYTTSFGGSGGETGGYYSGSANPGADSSQNGCGGGGAGGGNDGSGTPPGEDGGNTGDDFGWGKSGFGATGSAGGGDISGADCYGSLPQSGSVGSGGETAPIGIGGGGSGATRGYHGGCLYLQVAGTISVTAATVVIDASGTDGGTGGDGAPGGDGGTSDIGSGGGGGGGGAGGSGGAIIVRYKSGTFTSSNCNVAAGSGGTGGIAGIGAGVSISVDGTPGAAGSDGSTGSTNIASY